MKEYLKEHLRRKLFERYQDDQGDDTNIIPAAPDEGMSPVPPPKHPFYPFNFPGAIPWDYYYPYIRDNLGNGTWPYPGWNPYYPNNTTIDFGDVNIPDNYYR
jgi:hypothetical protein